MTPKPLTTAELEEWGHAFDGLAPDDPANNDPAVRLCATLKADRERIAAAVEALPGWRDPRYSGQFETPELIYRADVLAAIRTPPASPAPVGELDVERLDRIERAAARVAYLGCIGGGGWPQEGALDDLRAALDGSAHYARLTAEASATEAES